MLRSIGFFVALLTFGVLPEATIAQIQVNQVKSFDVKSYNATIWLNRKDTSISGWVEMGGVTLGNLSEILQHAKFLTIDSVFVDGIRTIASKPDSTTGAYTITGFPNNYPNGSDFILKTYYHGIGRNEGGTFAWGGVQNQGGMMFTMGVGFSAPYVSCTRYWLPCYDEPDDKADSVLLKFFADTIGTAAGDPDILVSNGIQTQYLAGTDNGRTNFFEWKISHPIATYLLTFALGPFKKLQIANPLDIPFDVYAFAKDTAQARLQMQSRVVPALVFFDSLFAPYPFEKVGYVIAPIGSMEHQTMITLVNSVLEVGSASSPSTTAVHELSHQWWGDRVTCFDFNDPWLNEGFAAFCESLFLERTVGKSKYWSAQHANISASLSPSEDTIPLYGAPFHTSPRNNYPPVIYQKGAAVLGMLRYINGDSTFFLALKSYGDHFAYSTVTSDDLQIAFEETMNKDLQWFFNKWVYGSGHPAITATWSHKGSYIGVHFVQTQDSAKAGFFRLPTIIEARASGGKIERHEVEMDSLRESDGYFTNSFIPDTIVIDPDGALIKKINGAVKLGVWYEPKPQPQPQITELRFAPSPTDQKNMMLYVTGEGFEFQVPHMLLEIYDTNGKNVFHSELNSPAGLDGNTVKYFFDPVSIASGTYFASVLLDNRIIAKGKLIISR